MRAIAAFGAAVFVALAVVIAVKLSADYLPAKHLDVAKSAYFSEPDGRARLVLTVQGVALDGTLHPKVRPPRDESADPVVEIRSATRPAPLPGHASLPRHGGTVTLSLDIPRAAHVTVLDFRWGHPEHPEGIRLPLQAGRPAGLPSPTGP